MGRSEREAHRLLEFDRETMGGFMNARTRDESLRYNGLAGAVYIACLAMAGQHAVAQEPVEEITITGSRLITSGVNTPTPVTAVTGADLQAMAPTTLIESLSQLPVFDNNVTSQQAVGGSVASGGSNLNLRGVGGERTLVLLDGHRLGPSNKFGTVDVSVIPEMLVSSVEAVTGGASAAYGADAVAGVVNFRLDRNFTGTKYSFQGGTTTYGDGGNYKAGVAYGSSVGERGHLIASVEAWKKNGIRSLESLKDRSDYLDLKAQVTNPDPNGPNFLARSFVSPTNFTAGGVLLQPGSAVDHIEFLPDGSGRYRQLPFSGVGQLTGGCNCQARPSLEYGVDADYEVDTPADRSSMFAHYEHDISDRSSFYVETLLADSEQANVWQTAALLGPWVGRVYADNPFLPAPLAQQLQSEGRQFAGFGIFPPNVSGNAFEGADLVAKNRYGQLVGGFSHDLDDDFLAGGWVLDGYAQYAHNRQETVAPTRIRTDRLFLAMDAVTGPNGQPVCRVSLFNVGIFDDCVPINLVGGTAAVTPAAAAYVLDDGKIARGRVSEYDAEVTLRGDLTRGSGVLGAITTAFGVSWRQQDLTVRTVDPCDEFPCTPDGVRLSDLGLMSPELRGILPQFNAAGLPDPNGIPGLRYVPPGFAGDSNSSTVLFTSQRFVEGASTVREAFFEFGIPLLENGKLNLNEAYRWADYSGSGSARAWKTGISYQAAPRFRIRATRSQDVRAPTLRERFEQQRGGVNVRDPQNNNAVISTANFTGGNPNVGVETAKTNVLGFVYEPLDRFSVTIDGYEIDLDGAIGQLTSQGIVDTCSASGGTSSLCQFVVRDSTGQINRVEALFINLSNQKVSGVDLELNFSGAEIGGGTLSWRFIGSRLNENSILTPGSARDERVGDVGVAGLPENKVTTSLRYARGPWSIFLQERYIGGGVDDRRLVESTTRIPGRTTIDDNTVDSVLYTDLTFNFTGGEGGGTPWETFFTINNLTNEEPPAMYAILGRAGVPGPNTFLYDTIGRRYAAGVRVNF
jgi:outer membrane receptor protein involved in Fe transport